MKYSEKTIEMSLGSKFQNLFEKDGGKVLPRYLGSFEGVKVYQDTFKSLEEFINRQCGYDSSPVFVINNVDWIGWIGDLLNERVPVDLRWVLCGDPSFKVWKKIHDREVFNKDVYWFEDTITGCKGAKKLARGLGCEIIHVGEFDNSIRKFYDI